MPGPDDERARDPSRREFFRAFSRDAVRNVGAAVGAAAELRRTSAEAARELLDLGSMSLQPASGAERLATREPPADTLAEPKGAESTFRSPYRFTGDELVILDQRELPGNVTTFSCTDASQVASAIRAGAINRGPVLAEVGAYSLVLAAAAAVARGAQSVEQHFRAAANALRAARQDVRALAYGIERVEARYDALMAGEANVDQLQSTLRATADEVAADAAADHAEIGHTGATALAAQADLWDPAGVMQLLIHGDMGPLSCGLIGTGTAIIKALTADGRRVHVWLTEAGPGNEGARIGALQLTQLDIPHTIVADSAVGWVLANRKLHAVLLRGDRVCSNGDSGTIIGGLNVARLAAAASVPLHVVAPRSSFDPGAADGSALRAELRSASEALAAGSADRHARRPSDGHLRRAPESLIGRRAGRAHHRAADRGRPGPADGHPARTRLIVATTARPGTATGERVLRITDTRDRRLLRDFLERDRLRAAYALCDLEEREFARTRWGVAWSAEVPVSVVLEYGGLTPQPLFVMGDADGIVGVLREVVRPRLVYLAADETLLPAVENVYHIDPGPQMMRMWVNSEMFKPVVGVATRLTTADVVDLNRLYGLGFSGWLPAESVANGIYYGVRVAGRLVAAAGTHVISPDARLGVVGNVLTHVDFRGRGFAKLTTGAVTEELLRSCDEVVLNVRADNPPAIAAYRALGYREYCRFEERLARRRGAAWGSIVAQLGRWLVRNREPA